MVIIVPYKTYHVIPGFLLCVSGDAEIAGVENAGMEIAAPEYKAENRRRKKCMESESFKNVFLTILTENRVMILACLAHRVDFECNV